MQAYRELARVFTRLYRLGHASAMLEWDQMVMLPPGAAAADARVAATAELDVVKHELITDPRVGEWLDTAEAAATSGDFTDVHRGNLAEMRRAYAAETKLPKDLVEALSTAKGRGEHVWTKARPANDWDAFKPALADVVALSRQAGEKLREGTDLTAYEALMDRYEPGLREATVDALFDDLKTWLPPLIQRVRAAQAAADATSPVVIPAGPFAVPAQTALGEEVLTMMGFDFSGGRLDVSAHPVTGGVAEDVRLTTRYNEGDCAEGLMGVVHEGGHSLYEQNRPDGDCRPLPGSQARSMGVHESQSLFFEMQIGRGLPFQRYVAPLYRKHFPAAAAAPSGDVAFSPENLFRWQTRVAPGLIRVDADELTYPMHVILRYEIEKALIAGTATVDDVPRLWREKMQVYLGLDVSGAEGSAIASDRVHRDGAMQDIHWAVGYLGYFPTYTIGAMLAAQFMAAVRRDLGGAAVDAAIAAGNLSPVTAWLREKVWRRGSLVPTATIVADATGEPLNAAHFRRHLESRYLPAEA